MKLAVLGGSFNPVHKGHVALASSVIDLLGYDRVLLVPALMSPHKRGDSYIESEHRVRMVELAFEGKSWAEICLTEIKRSGPSYTYHTIEEIYRDYAFEGKPGLIVGDDWVGNFSRWWKVDEIIESTDLIVARREGRSADFPYPCTYLDNAVVSVSSTEIRKCRKEGKPVDGMVPSSVASYMETHGLYTD